MLFHKTNKNQRQSYSYHYFDGINQRVCTIKPGADGVTAADVKRLHALDDAEVYNNWKNWRPKLSEEEKAARREWEAAHPGEKFPVNTVLSLEPPSDCAEVNQDKSHVMAEAVAERVQPQVLDMPRVKELFPFLTARQLEVFYLVKVEEYSETEVARMLEVSVANVSKHLSKAMAQIRSHEEDFFPAG